MPLSPPPAHARVRLDWLAPLRRGHDRLAHIVPLVRRALAPDQPRRRLCS